MSIDSAILIDAKDIKNLVHSSGEEGLGRGIIYSMLLMVFLFLFMMCFHMVNSLNAGLAGANPPTNKRAATCRLEYFLLALRHCIAERNMPKFSSTKIIGLQKLYYSCFLYELTSCRMQEQMLHTTTLFMFFFFLHH